jgi:hypothetical protein
MCQAEVLLDSQRAERSSGVGGKSFEQGRLIESLF